MRVLEEPEWELRGAMCFANRLMSTSVDSIRMWARAAFRELRREGLLRHQQNAAKSNGATKTSKNVGSTGCVGKKICQDDASSQAATLVSGDGPAAPAASSSNST